MANWDKYLWDNGHIFDLINTWGEDRGIVDNSTPQAQFEKTLEEVQELSDSIKDGGTWEEFKDAIGDIVVTLCMVAKTADVDIRECIELAYEDIKDRKGYLTPEGIFVKEV